MSIVLGSSSLFAWVCVSCCFHSCTKFLSDVASTDAKATATFFASMIVARYLMQIQSTGEIVSTAFDTNHPTGPIQSIFFQFELFMWSSMISWQCSGVTFHVDGAMWFKGSQSVLMISPSTIPAPGMNVEAYLAKHSSLCTCTWNSPIAQEMLVRPAGSDRNGFPAKHLFMFTQYWHIMS